MNNKSAFKKAGVYPFNPSRIMCSCPHFRDLNQEKANFVMHSIERLIPIIRENGKVTEEVYGAILNERFPDIVNTKARTGMRLDDMTTNRQQSLIMNNPVYLESLRVTESQKSFKDRPSKSKTSDKMINCSHCLGKFLSNATKKCSGKYCKSHYCCQLTCLGEMLKHQNNCQKVKNNM
jgi:hypothetical protein